VSSRERGYAIGMQLRRRKSKTARATDALGTYVKFKTAGKAAKGARKAAKGTAAYQVAKRTPFVKRIPLIVVGVGLLAFIGVKALRSSDDESAATA
jgi:hypothetical protein